MNNLLVTMSGGTTSVINATLAGIIDESLKSDIIDNIYAGYPGMIGVFQESFLDLTKSDTHILKHSPGSASIGTSRVDILNDSQLDILQDTFHKNNIKYFINIGGNGTIKQSKLIASKIDDITIAAAPKTVDNDLGDSQFEDLWFTPGFPSCVNYWYHKIKMLNNENIGACTHDKVIIAQAFGRKTGFITGAMRMFDPDRKTPLILLMPEDQQSPQTVIEKIKETVSGHGRAIVGICEGYDVKDYDFEYDKSGQEMYGSSSSSAVQELVNLCLRNNVQARGYNPTVDQRQNFQHTLSSDRNISYEIGKEIINNFCKGKSHFLQSYSTSGLKCINLNDITNFSRVMKDEWIDWGNFDVSDSYIKYLSDFTDIQRHTPIPRHKLFVKGEVT
tara:strand:+ start:13701 stop:14867 length:1167 start_codon:yes stop_codon:yes gene_type:complete